ncbi:MAG TPA: hypothetical protein VL181_10790 [Holophagaceae bacterium]|nr:hypothetical protein [Holophagaceae bacterium]
MSGLEQLLPHRGPAILLDGMKEIGPDGCVATYRVKADDRHLDAAGNLPAWVGLELMALAASAFSGRRNTLSGRPVRVGYLLGTRSFTAAVPSFPVGTELEIEARVLFLDESGPSAFRCELRRDGQPVAAATLKAIEHP